MSDGYPQPGATTTPLSHLLPRSTAPPANNDTSVRKPVTAFPAVLRRMGLCAAPWSPRRLPSSVSRSARPPGDQRPEEQVAVAPNVALGGGGTPSPASEGHEQRVK